ncbi:hypothetical protein QBC35DRAFT_274002 [Podospora australis]|uniref:Uncharacterized protein n=1 Tax=Podospora australis TaxID=1536484 RepID=A0AAN7AF48_9PEZI|nr:hypothetical protein QBC35DRAFT_274002 [Podospora australis]
MKACMLATVLTPLIWNSHTMEISGKHGLDVMSPGLSGYAALANLPAGMAMKALRNFHFPFSDASGLNEPQIDFQFMLDCSNWTIRGDKDRRSAKLQITESRKGSLFGQLSLATNYGALLS